MQAKVGCISTNGEGETEYYGVRAHAHWKDAYLKAAKKQKEVVGLGSHVPPRPH